MTAGYGCTTDGEYEAGNVEGSGKAASCGEVCEKLGLEGCCEWQHDHQKCMFQPNDNAVSVDSGRSGWMRWGSDKPYLRSAAYCSSDSQGK